jgi:endogenous inhibitor of DNA gyrase (YacG/DUF329 family)
MYNGTSYFWGGSNIMWLETIYESKNHEEKCPTCGGDVQRRVFGEMYAGSFIQNGERVEIRRVPNEGFANPIYLDPLTQYFDGGLYRKWPNEVYFSRGGKKLHRSVWEQAFGKIPDGHHIHHKDSNPSNNNIENLECLAASDHRKQTHVERKKRGYKSEISELARKKAAEWHQSEEGRLWHKRHAERSKGWTKWKRIIKNCKYCNKEFEGLDRKSGYSQIYCTTNCKAADYRKRKAAGLS